MLERVPDEVKAEARQSYAGALIGGFHSSLGLDTPEARDMGRRCRNEIREYLPDLRQSSRSSWARAMGILLAPNIYSVAQRLYMRRVYARIRRQVEQIRKEEQR